MKRRKTAFELLAQAPDGKKRKKEKNADVGADGDSISNDGRTESVGYSSDSDDDEDVEDDEDDEPFDGREHYLDVSKSELRNRVALPLGPEYGGTGTTRDEALRDGFDDRLARQRATVHRDDGIESTDDEGGTMDSMGSERGSGDSGSEDDSDMESDEDDGNMEAGNGDDYRERRKFNGEDARNGADGSASALPHHEQSNRTARTNGGPGSTQRNGHDRSMAEDDAAFTQNLRNAVSADAAKGRAIKGQRGVFDALLNCRIKLQKAVIASNSITLLQPEGPCDGDGTDGTDDASRAQQLARTLAGTEKLLSQMQQLHSTQPADPGADPASPRQIWAAMERTERAATARRHAVLNKWADRTRAAQPAGRAPASRPSAQTTATDVLTAALADRPKLRARVHLARSCAPAHVARGIRSSERVYDDADFYGLLLQSLLDQRGQEAFAMAVAVAGAGTDPSTTALRGLKVKKPGLDTKASKGRRLRYTVHEKLENFMAPEDRTSWPERRVVELFSALFGHVGTLPDGDQRADWEQDQVQRPDVADEGGANGNGNGYGIGNGDVGMSGLHLFRGSRTYSTAHE